MDVRSAVEGMSIVPDLAAMPPSVCETVRNVSRASESAQSPVLSPSVSVSQHVTAYEKLKHRLRTLKRTYPSKSFQAVREGLTCPKVHADL